MPPSDRNRIVEPVTKIDRLITQVDAPPVLEEPSIAVKQSEMDEVTEWMNAIKKTLFVNDINEVLPAIDARMRASDALVKAIEAEVANYGPLSWTNVLAALAAYRKDIPLVGGGGVA